MRKPTVTIRVPATTANLGPGFDTLGIALKLHNHISIRESDPPGMELVGVSKGVPGATEMANETANAFFDRAKIKPHGAQLEVKGEVPVSCGLGSSVTVRLGIIYALNEIDGRPLSDAAMLDLVSDLEGHPDNAAPALFGGFVASGVVNGNVRYRRFSIPASLKFVCCVPDFAISTDKARAVLPKQVPYADAVENLSRVALLVSVFASGEFSLLRGLFEDCLHQPYRRKLIPQLDDCIHAGTEAGALGGWLSGSGSAIMCLTETKEKAVAEAMADVFSRQKIRTATHILHADNDGTRVRRV